MANRTFVVGVGMTKFEKPGSRDWEYPDMAREAVGKWSALDQARFANILAMAQRQGYRMVPTGLNHWALRSMLRYIGAQTRYQRAA